MRAVFYITITLLFFNVEAIPKEKPASGRIIGGQVATAGQFPYLAAIYIDKPTEKLFCSGTLLQEQWILTAAQCAYGATLFTISLGSTTLNGTDPNRVTVTATNYFLYDEAGNEYDPDILWHDIALIKLDSPVTTNDYIQTILWAAMGYLYPTATLTTMGWGQISDADTTDSNELRYVDVAVIDQFDCKEYYGEQLWNDMICTVGAPNEGICLGDVGAPLVAKCLVFDCLVTAGIGSFISGNGCENSDPKGYTRVDAYEGWISDKIANN